MKTIGFIGLGHMGLPMALNLIKSGFEVTGYDLQAAALATLKAAGGRVAENLEEAARNQDMMITMLQTGEQVQSVCLGSAGLFAHAKRDAVYVDCSSIDVTTSKQVYQEALAHHLQAVDAPVSGGVSGAQAGTLTFMAGGEVNTFNTVRPILEAMGKMIIHTGPSGSGQAAKICNNMILGISMIAISEAFTLGKKLGLSPEKLFEVVTNSSGQCWAMSRYVPVPGILDQVPANRDYQPGFTSAMMLKDLRLSQQSATSTEAKTPLGELATDLYQRFVETGQGELDFSAIIRYLDTL